MTLEAPAQDVERKALVRATFNAAARHFDAPPLFFWERLGRRTVELAGVTSGNRVLDVCCGAGASALPAARAVGPGGHVLGIDLADELLRRARRKAVRSGLGNVSFRQGDMERLDVPAGSVDVVVCVLGLYFAIDLPAAVASMWRALRPGGTLAVTTWGARALEPVNSAYLDAVAEACPELDLRTSTLSWARINTPERIEAVFAAAGTAPPEITTETVVHRLTGEDLWTVVLGSGYRVMLDAMSPRSAARVRTIFLRRARADGVEEVVADVLYVRAHRRDR